MSSSDVRRTASSNAKFGAAVATSPLRANSCIHRAGFCRNAIGLVNTAWKPRDSGAKMPSSRPMS